MKQLVALLLLISGPLMADYPLEIIELKSRPMEEVLPLVQPFIDSDGSIAGMNNQLIIRTSKRNLEEIRDIINRIDSPPRRLLIYVSQGRDSALSRQGSAVDINAMVGNDAKVVVGRAEPGSSVRYRVRGGSIQSNRDIVQRLQVLDGHPAFIAVGRQLPVEIYHTEGHPSDINGGRNTIYQPATTGFYILPRTTGDRVTLQVSPHMVRQQQGQGFDFAQASTLLSGRLGEWLSLGGTTGSGYAGDRRIGTNAGSADRQDTAISLRVEELPQ